MSYGPFRSPPAGQRELLVVLLCIPSNPALDNGSNQCRNEHHICQSFKPLGLLDPLGKILNITRIKMIPYFPLASTHLLELRSRIASISRQTECGGIRTISACRRETVVVSGAFIIPSPSWAARRRLTPSPALLDRHPVLGVRRIQWRSCVSRRLS